MTSTLLSIRFASHREGETVSLRSRRDPKSAEGPPYTPCAMLEEVPEWAPRRNYPPRESRAAGLVDHYESWQGICW
jgi:hypothetical protein